ncbi:MAG: hypothetical protein ACJ72D_19815 [Marmoricola sp.]
MVPADLAEAVVGTERLHGERVARRLERFAALPDGTVAWTRDETGVFHRGTFEGPWFYDDDADAAEVDLVHVRPCAWSAPSDVPGAVRAAFDRGGRNFQRIGRL